MRHGAKKRGMPWFYGLPGGVCARYMKKEDQWRLHTLSKM